MTPSQLLIPLLILTSNQPNPITNSPFPIATLHSIYITHFLTQQYNTPTPPQQQQQIFQQPLPNSPSHTHSPKTKMINLNFIERQHFHVTLFLLSSLSLFHATLAQSAAHPVAPRTVDDNTNSSLAIVLAVMIFAFFIMGFCSFYIRTCSDTYVVTGTNIAPRGGIDPEVLATFPIMVYSTVKTGHNVALQCAVCLSEFKDFDKLRLLPKCSHVFHPDCIDAWLASHVTCPVCRAQLKPDCAEVKVEIGEESDARHVFDESSVRRGEGVFEGNEGGVCRGVDGGVGKDKGSSKMGAFGVLVRSHSTGHSLVEPGKGLERYTLRLPEEVRKQILEGNERRSVMMIKRSASYDVVWQCGEGCSGKGGSDGGEGSSKGKNNNRWVLSMTPPFVSGSWDSSSGVTPSKCTNFSGIPRFWASSVLREDKKCEGRTSFQV